jgi:hypothetical protein
MLYINVDINFLCYLPIRFFFNLGGTQTFEATQQDVRVASQKKLQYYHRLKYLAMKNLFPSLCVTSQAKGVDQGSPFITFVDDNQPIIDEGMGRGDHQTS